jgi:cytochrome P450
MSDNDAASTSAGADGGLNWWGMLTDPAFIGNPYPELHRLRRAAAVHRDEGSGIFFVLGHAEFRQMAMAPEMGRDTRLWTYGWNRPESKERDPLSYELFSAFQQQMVNANPPDHRRMRDVFEKLLRPSEMASYAAMIEAECAALIEQMPVGQPFDFMSSFARLLPTRVARNLYGIGPEMDDQLALWNAAVIKIGDILMGPEQKKEALEALRAYKAFLRRHLDRPRQEHACPFAFVDSALEAMIQGVMDEEETLNNLLGIISGNETTATLLGNGLYALLQNPAELARLRADRSLMRPAIEEMLRFEPAINFILRVAITDFRLGDVEIPAGSMAIGLVCAINRDPLKFDKPDAFDAGRNPNAQSIFGGGPHVCIGAALARLEAQTAFTALLDRFPEIALGGTPAWWSDRTNQRGLETLTIIVKAH